MSACVCSSAVCAQSQPSPDQTAHMEESTALSALKQHGCKQRQTNDTYRRTYTWPPLCLEQTVTTEVFAPPSYLHRHLKLVQPLLLQLPGLKEKFKAGVALLVRHVEPVAPLWISGRRQKLNMFMFMHVSMYANYYDFFVQTL